MIKKLEKLFHGNMKLKTLSVKILLGHFTKKNCKRQIKLPIRIENVIKKISDKLVSSEKVSMIRLIAR